MAFNFLPDKKQNQSAFAAGMRRGERKKPKDGVNFLGGGDDRPQSGNLFAHLRPADTGYLWGMSRTAAFRLYGMLVLFTVMLLAVVLNLPGKWYDVQDDLATNRAQQGVGSKAAGNAAPLRNPDDSMQIVRDDPTAPDADNSVQTPTAAGAQPDQPAGADNQPGDPGDPGSQPVAPVPPPLDPDDYQKMRARAIEAGENLFTTPRLEPIPESIIATYDNGVDAVYVQDYGALHHWLLQQVASHPADEIEAAVVPVNETPRTWFEVGHSEDMIYGMVGRTFQIEGTLFELEQVPAAAFNLEDTEVAGRKVETLWRGLVSFGFDRIELGESGRTIRETGNVQFTLFGDLPEGVTAERVKDAAAPPVRVKLTGLFFHLRRHKSPGGSVRVVPHLVAGPIRPTEALPVKIDQRLLDMIDTSTDVAREYVPLGAQQMLLYYLKHTPDAHQTLEGLVDETVTYGDLFRQPDTYCQKPTVLQFEGQIGKYGPTPEEPIAEYELNPNPWGLRRQYMGAMVVLDERSQQQTVIFDALEWLCWDEKAQKHYSYRTAKAGDGKMPCGDPIPAHPFAAGDEVIVTGYFLTKWRYRTRGTGEPIDVVRVVAHSIVQRPPRTDPVTGMKWVFVLIFALIMAVVYWLFRRESANANEFRREFLSKHVRKARPSKPGDKPAEAGETAAADAAGTAGAATAGEAGAESPTTAPQEGSDSPAAPAGAAESPAGTSGGGASPTDKPADS